MKDELIRDLVRIVGDTLKNGKYDVWTDSFVIPSDYYTGLLATYADIQVERFGLTNERP